MSFAWTNDSVIDLIENYRLCECLWNEKHPQFKCRNAKQDSWTLVAEKTGSNVEEVKRKMKNIISQFHRERKRYRALKKEGSGSKFVSKWFAYGILLFLANKNRIRKSTDKGVPDEHHTSDSSGTDSEEIESQDPISADKEVEEILSFSIVEETDNDTETRKTFVEEGRTTPPVPSTSGNQALKVFKRPRPIRRKKRRVVAQTDERQEDAHLLMKQLQNKKPRNHFQIFGELVASKMESLQNENAQNTVEHLISNILYEASMGKYDRPIQWEQDW